MGNLSLSNDMDEFATKDMHFAAYLKLKGAALVRLEKQDSVNRWGKTPIFFIFSDKPTCEKLGKLFWDQGDFVDIREYLTALRDMRAQVGEAVSNHSVDLTKKPMGYR